MKTQIENRVSPLTIIIHFAFLICGIITVLIGQILPVLMKRLELNDAQAGQLFFAQLSGSFCGTFVFGFGAKRYGFIKTVIFGFILITVGCLLLNSDSWIFCVLGLFLNGIGIGCCLPSLNMLVVVLNPERQASALSILNFFWGVGAIISQPFIAFFGTANSIFVPTLMLSSLFFLTMLALYFIRTDTGKNESKDEPDETSNSKVWTHPLAWLITAFNFIHVGFETGAGGWLTTYSERFPEGANSLLSAAPAFFLFFVIGRGIAPLFLRFLSVNKFLFSSLIVLFLGTIVISMAQSFGVLVFGACISGFGTSAIFPTNMARFTNFFGESATRKAMPLFLSGSLGGAITFWLIGSISEKAESLQSGIFILLLSCLILIILQIVIALNSVRKLNSAK